MGSEWIRCRFTTSVCSNGQKYSQMKPWWKVVLFMTWVYLRVPSVGGITMLGPCWVHGLRESSQAFDFCATASLVGWPGGFVRSRNTIHGHRHRRHRVACERIFRRKAIFGGVHNRSQDYSKTVFADLVFLLSQHHSPLCIFMFIRSLTSKLLLSMLNGWIAKKIDQLCVSKKRSKTDAGYIRVP